MTVRYNVGDRVRVLTLTRDDMMLIDFLKVNHVDEYGIMVDFSRSKYQSHRWMQHIHVDDQGVAVLDDASILEPDDPDFRIRIGDPTSYYVRRGTTGGDFDIGIDLDYGFGQKRGEGLGDAL